MRIDFELDDLTNSALKRLVKQLLAANDSEEKAILEKLAKKAGTPPKNDLADLHDEMHGKPNTPDVEEDDDPFELEARGSGDESDAGDSESDMMPKKGKK